MELDYFNIFHILLLNDEDRTHDTIQAYIEQMLLTNALRRNIGGNLHRSGDVNKFATCSGLSVAD